MKKMMHGYQKVIIQIVNLNSLLEIINDKKSNVGVNTHRANRIVEEALNNFQIKELKKFSLVKREVVFSKETRFDFLLENKNNKAFWR